jgi:acetyl-CoA C-acetyltransferase
LNTKESKQPMEKAFILDAVRTPRGRGKPGKGALSGVHPQELLAQTLRAITERTAIDPRSVDDVIAGSVSQVGEQGANVARQAVLSSGLPYEVPAMTVQRFCGSGIAAVQLAAMGVASGAQDLVIAGGVESMSRVPMGADESQGDGKNPKLRERYFQLPQGVAADLIATLEGFGREDVDGFALRSQQLAVRAIEEKRFARSLVPVVDPASGRTVLSADESPRPDTTLQGLLALPASFAEVGQLRFDVPEAHGRSLDEIALAAYPSAGAIRHVHTAGNSSGLSDGAAAVLLASQAYVQAHGTKPRARVRAFANTGSEPIIMLTAPSEASRRALARAGMKASDIDLWEINEAFAAIPLRTIRELAIDPERVNVNGGAIALGHPLGATGAILLSTALDELERAGLATALITLCTAGGQGVALVLERV